MTLLKTFAIAGAALGASYGFLFAQSLETGGQSVPASASISDDDFAAMVNFEAADMFAVETAPQATENLQKVYILGLDNVASSFFCALDVLDLMALKNDQEFDGILFIDANDIAPFLTSESCAPSGEPEVLLANIVPNS